MASNLHSKRVLFVVTDCISFNVLCKGQLEYLVSERKFKLDLVCGGSKEEVKKLIERDVGKVFHVSSLCRNPSPIKDLLTLLQLLRIFARRKPSVVVLSTPKALLLGSVAAFVSGVPVRIALVRGRVYEHFSGPKRWFYSLLDKLSLALSTWSVFISQEMMRVFGEEQLSAPDKSLIIGSGSSNGVDVDHFRPATLTERNLVRRNLLLAPQDFVVLCIGRLCRDKGAEDLISVLKCICFDCVFVWVGPVEDRNLLERLSSSLGVNARFKHFSRVDDVRPFYWASNLHLFLSYREGFGNVALEAASCGLPTIAYDVSGIRDSVPDGVSGVRIPFGDTFGVARAIERLHAYPDERAKLGEGGRSWAKDNFEQRKLWSRWADFLESP
jgi:glycosyltransferase involved in cell wall biosynthesis